MAEAKKPNLPVYFILTLFFLSGSVFAQNQTPAPVTYQYQQFLNTAKADLNVNLPFSFSSVQGKTLFRYQTQINKNNQNQIRDEFVWDFSQRIPVVDSFGVVTDLKTVSVFLDQEKQFSRSLEWAGTAGVFYQTDWQNTQAGYGRWLIEQNHRQEDGPAFDVRHQSTLPVADWISGNMDLNWFNGSAGKRELDRKNLSFSVKDPDSRRFALTYQRYQIDRDYLSGPQVQGLVNLDYRKESSDRLGFQFDSPEWFDWLRFDVHSSWSNRTVIRKSDLATALNPNYQVRSGTFENEIGVSVRLFDWSLRFPVAVSSGDEKYSVLSTTGLTGYNEEIQDQKLKRRNLETAKFRVNPSLTYNDEKFGSETEVMVTKDQLFNPENSRYDDYDIIAVGVRQELIWRRTFQSEFVLEGDLQLAHQVFIHQDRSGDNFRNTFSRVAGTWSELIFPKLTNLVRVQISSQLRTYDYDAKFISKKSFSFRVLTIEDSLAYRLGEQVWFFRGKTTETSQGIYYPDPVKEYPVRHLSYYLAEPGVWIWQQRIALSWRFMNQDQFGYQGGKKVLQQKIEQSGPVIMGSFFVPWMEISGDIWLMSRKLTGQKAEFLPSVTISCRYEF
ncbi:MAG: hypothetical protein J0L62_13420 [Bacteroidetes bacterium]|nr:hypothetical protein [Bacteroidota bacterium]